MNIIKEFLKAQEKPVMTKREIIFYVIKLNIFSFFGSLLLWYIVYSSVDNLQDKFIVYFVLILGIAFLFISPNYNYYRRWHRWDKTFPRTVYINPETRIKKKSVCYKNSLDKIAYLVAVDSQYKNVLKDLTEDDKIYLTYILDSCLERDKFDSIEAPYNIDPK